VISIRSGTGIFSLNFSALPNTRAMPSPYLASQAWFLCGGDVIRVARAAGEDHDVAAGAVAVEVQGDPGPLDDMVDPVRLDRVVDQDRVVVLEQESDRVRLWGAVLADRGDPDDLFLAQPAWTPSPNGVLGSGSPLSVMLPKPSG
jgi:hypothetical protein